MLLTNVEAGLSTEPDGMFISYATLNQGKARLRKGGQALEIEGTPDMVLEVVSPTSVEKDTKVLRDLYWRAGVSEYWLADPRGDDLSFDILRHGPKGYTAVRRSRGWLRSIVSRQAFRLTCQNDALNIPVYDLAVKNEALP
jgi:Uma2 family endonuclease